MHKNYFLDVITRKPELFAAIMRFNGIAAGSEDQGIPGTVRECCADLPSGCLEELWGYAPSRQHLQRLGQPAEQFWDFSEESRCLALLDSETLDKLTVMYGACLHAPEIARTVRGTEVKRLRQALGEQIYLYALQRGQYQVPTGRELFVGRHLDMPLEERIARHGREALEIIAADWPEHLRERIFGAAAPDLSFAGGRQQGIWFDMKKILLREVAPAWAPYFG